MYDKEESYSLADFHVKMLTPDVALVTYKVNLKATFRGVQYAQRPFYIGSVWARRQGQWKDVFYEEGYADELTDLYKPGLGKAGH
jgi:hypothetical protein